MKIRNNYIQNFIKKTENKKFYDKFNRNIPIIETALSGICYSSAIYLNKKIDKERKPALIWQAVLGCVLGMVTSKLVDESINKLKNNVCENIIDNNKIKNLNKIVRGIRIAVPLLTVGTITRFLIPTILAPISTKIEEHRNILTKKYKYDNLK